MSLRSTRCAEPSERREVGRAGKAAAVVVRQLGAVVEAGLHRGRPDLGQAGRGGGVVVGPAEQDDVHRRALGVDVREVHEHLVGERLEHLPQCGSVQRLDVPPGVGDLDRLRVAAGSGVEQAFDRGEVEAPIEPRLHRFRAERDGAVLLRDRRQHGHLRGGDRGLALGAREQHGALQTSASAIAWRASSTS